MASTPRSDGSTGKASPPPPPIEYAYMYEKDKSPSKQLDALLRAISRHVVLDIGEKDACYLTPPKLAAFYKAVGGDYDALFNSMPNSAISYMWQVTGCQHSLLQPVDDDFAPPSIPALTARGFSRWESLEILLGPEEHVPFLQYAVRNWNLKHPETGQEFPTDLPKSVFPKEADPDVDLWHRSCADRLRKDAQPHEREAPAGAAGSSPEQPAEPRFAYSHVRGPFQSARSRAAGDQYFERPVSYNHVSGRQQSGRGSARSPDKYYQDRHSSEQARRKSFSDYSMSSPRTEPHSSHSASGNNSAYLDPYGKRPAAPRRHSQPKHDSSEPSEEEPNAQPRPRRSDNHSSSSPPGRRSKPSEPEIVNPPSFRPHRSELRAADDQPRRRPPQSPSLRDKMAEKMSNILPNGMTPDRLTRGGSVRHSYNDTNRSRRSRERPPPPSRPSRSFSDLDSNHASDSEGSNDETYKPRKSRDERDRDRYRERDHGRIRDDERRERHYPRRPGPERRTSSHADMDRRRERDQPVWDTRNWRDERKRWEKRVSPADRGASPITGVTGRRYPEPAFT